MLWTILVIVVIVLAVIGLLAILRGRAGVGRENRAPGP